MDTLTLTHECHISAVAEVAVSVIANLSIQLASSLLATAACFNQVLTLWCVFDLCLINYCLWSFYPLFLICL